MTASCEFVCYITGQDLDVTERLVLVGGAKDYAFLLSPAEVV